MLAALFLSPVTAKSILRNVILYVFHSKGLTDKDTAVKRTDTFTKVTKGEIWECNPSFHSVSAI